MEELEISIPSGSIICFIWHQQHQQPRTFSMQVILTWLKHFHSLIRKAGPNLKGCRVYLMSEYGSYITFYTMYLHICILQKGLCSWNGIIFLSSCAFLASIQHCHLKNVGNTIRNMLNQGLFFYLGRFWQWGLRVKQ